MKTTFCWLGSDEMQYHQALYNQELRNRVDTFANVWKPAPSGPYMSDVLNTRLAEAKAWLKERQNERVKQ